MGLSRKPIALWTTACGKKRWLGEDIRADDIRQLSDEQLWQMRIIAAKEAASSRVRKRYARQRASVG